MTTAPHAVVTACIASAAWGGQPQHARTRPDAVLRKPVQRGFQRIAHIGLAAVHVFGLRLHVGDIDNAAIRGDEGDRQGNERVFHPHAHRLRLGKHKHHAAIRGQTAAVHQPGLLLLGGRSHLGGEGVAVDLQAHQRQAGIDLGLRGPGRVGTGQYKSQGDAVDETRLVHGSVLVRWRSSIALQQAHRAGGDAFAPADEAQTLGGLAFDVDLRRVQLQQRGDALADGVAIRRELGRLRDHGAVHIADRPALRQHALARLPQQFARICALVARVCIGEMLADVAQPGRAQQSVGDGVQQHVGIGMAE